MALPDAQEFSIEIGAAPLDCFDVITDFERYPQWASAIQQVTVLERDPDGVGRVVELWIDIKFRRIRYVLEYAYRKPRELTWRSVGGDVEAIEGAYHFRKLAPKRTEATCRQAVVLGFWVPGPIRRLLELGALRQSVQEFKQEVERRLGERPSRARRSG